MDPYEALGVAPDAKEDEIKRKYRSRAQECHPDKRNGNEEEFKEINKAYALLSNPEKREHYDQTGEFAKKKSVAASRLAELFDSFIEQGVHQCDIIEFAREKVRENFGKIESARAKINMEIRHLEKKKGRIICKNEHNIYEQLLSKKIEGKIKCKEHLEKDEKLLNELLELLDEYEDSEPEEKPQQIWHSSISPTTAY